MSIFSELRHPGEVKFVTWQATGSNYVHVVMVKADYSS